MCQVAERIPLVVHNAPQVSCPKIQPYLLVYYEVWEKNYGDGPPRSFADYMVTVDGGNVPAGVEAIEML